MGDYRRHAVEILLDLADGHSQADPELHPLDLHPLELCPVPDPLPFHLRDHVLVRAEASVLRGKANDCGPRHAGDEVRRLILHWAVHWAAPRERVVPVSLQSIQPLVCFVAHPAAPLGAELLHPCLVRQWSLAGSCVPADVRAACLRPFLTGTRSRPICPQAGADPSTPFLPREGWLQVLEARQAWEGRQPASEGGRPVKLGGQALRDGRLSELSTVSGESQSLVRPPQPFPEAPQWLPAELPAQQIRANHLPGSNKSGHPSKANESAAWRPSRAPLPARVNGRPPGKERSRSLHSTLRRPTAGTWIPAAKARSPARYRQPLRAPPDAVPGAVPTGSAGPLPRRPG
jgi:hypothetical protein